MKVVKENLFFYLSIVIIFTLFFLTIQNGFFWDTTQLGSLHATHYYTTNFTELLLPDNMDSGHIPAFGIYLAFLWKLFGRSLIVSHLAILPFIIGIVWQLKILIKYFFEPKYLGIVLLLVILDPTLLAQLTLVSPDILLVFFMFLALNAILKNNKKLLLIGVFLLFLTSMRGMMVAFILLLIDVFYTISFKENKQKIFLRLLKRSLLYLPALLVFIFFNVYHYHVKKWFGFHDDSPWASCFEPVDFKGFVFNIGVLGWRILDFGRVGVWLVFGFLFIKNFKTIFKNKQLKFLFLSTLAFIIILPLNMVWAKNLLGHRYLMPIYLIFALLTAKILFTLKIANKLRNVLITVWLLILISGNFWIYPDKTSQGWDATLAHLPYYKLRKQAILYLDNQKIDFTEVSTFFPNTSTIDAIDLNNDARIFKPYSLGSKYVLYANVFNIDDDSYNELTKNYILLKEYKSNNLFFRVLRYNP